MSKLAIDAAQEIAVSSTTEAWRTRNFTRLWLFFICILGFVGAQAEDLSKSVVRITAARDAGPPAISSGFYFRVGARVGVLTTLHGVLGANRITVRNESSEFQLQLDQVDVTHDLAFLTGLPDGANAPTLTPESWRTQGVDKVVGYPQGIMSQLSDPISLREVPATPLVLLLQGKLFEQFQLRKSPDLHIQVLSVRGRLQPGDSGAPILDHNGGVVGVGSGGLAGGFADVNWAIPIDAAQWTGVAEAASELHRLAALPVDVSFQILELSPDGLVQPRLSFLAEPPVGKVPQVALPICELTTAPPGYRYLAPMIPETSPGGGYNARPGLFGPDGAMDFGGGNEIENPWGFEVKQRPGAGKVFGQCAQFGDPSGIEATTSDDVPVVTLTGYTDREPRDVQAQIILWAWFKNPPSDSPVTATLEYQLLGDSAWTSVKTTRGTPTGGTYSSKLSGMVPGFAKVRFQVFVPPKTVNQDHVTISDARIINARAHKDFLNSNPAAPAQPSSAEIAEIDAAKTQLRRLRATVEPILEQKNLYPFTGTLSVLTGASLQIRYVCPDAGCPDGDIGNATAMLLNRQLVVQQPSRREALAGPGFEQYLLLDGLVFTYFQRTLEGIEDGTVPKDVDAYAAILARAQAKCHLDSLAVDNTLGRLSRLRGLETNALFWGGNGPFSTTLVFRVLDFSRLEQFGHYLITIARASGHSYDQATTASVRDVTVWVATEYASAYASLLEFERACDLGITSPAATP